MARGPRVAIGLPVRNGESFLAAAISSLLAQTYDDFALLIADNASTDVTEEIARAAAAGDPRVRYHRHHTDVGAPANFDYVFHATSGEYFRWAAHDDLVDREHLRCCIDALDDDHAAVLATSDAVYVDELGRELPQRWRARPELAAARPGRRLVAAAHAVPAAFGLVRRETLATTSGMQPFTGSDRLLLVELALRGPFHLVPGELLRLREHRDRYSTTVIFTAQERAWLDPTGTRARTGMPSLRVAAASLGAIARAPITPVDRVECCLAVGRLVQRWRTRIRHELGIAWRQLRARLARTGRSPIEDRSR